MDSEKSTLQIQVNFDPKGQILWVTSGSNSKIYSKNHRKSSEGARII